MIGYKIELSNTMNDLNDVQRRLATTKQKLLEIEDSKKKLEEDLTMKDKEVEMWKMNCMISQPPTKSKK